VYLTGSFRGNVDFGGDPFTAPGDSTNAFYLAAFDPDGFHLWSLSAGDESSQGGTWVTTDSENNVIVTGQFDGTMEFGSDTLATNGAADILLLKFDVEGAYQWGAGFGGALADEGIAVTTDGSDNIIVTGYFEGSVDFGGGPLSGNGGMDVFLAKFAPDGSHLESVHFGDTGNDAGHGVFANSADDIVITGGFAGDVSFGGELFSSVGDYDVFVAQFDSNLEHLWSSAAGGEDMNSGYSVWVDGADNVLVTGAFNGVMNLGGGWLDCTGDWDFFAAAFDVAGEHLWSICSGDTNDQRGYAIAADSLGDVLVTGFFWESIVFGDDVLTSSGDADVFLSKLSP
jgi:hypothetical protein